mmetsp:Transcript_43728/g.129443  ORF Transcript_43728/g.129443 Transcript_43728/m.129443 type:complete len:792 (+) Transcript_43728:182-2557(+)
MGRVRAAVKRNNDGGSSGSTRSLSSMADARDLKQPSPLEELGSLPWLVLKDKPLELIFFQKLYVAILKQVNQRKKPAKPSMSAFIKAMDTNDLTEPTTAVPLMEIQRAMSRLYQILQDNRDFNAKKYDINDDGCVGWWEFCVIWNKERPYVRLTTMERIFLTFEDSSSSRLSKLASMFVLVAIIVSAGSFIISTMPSFMYLPECPSCAPKPFAAFKLIDTVCVVLFTCEYAIRLFTSAFMRMELVNLEDLIGIMCSDDMHRPKSKLQKAWSFASSWANLIDAAAILPSYIAWLLDALEDGTGPQWKGDVIKLTRLMRVVRAFRLGRRFEAVIIVARSMKRSVRALWVLVLNISMGMLIFGSMMYFLEQGDYQPESQVYKRNPPGLTEESYGVTPFQSIPHSFWWALVTSATVGYGDVYPTTEAGKIVAGVAMVWSLCVLALPIGVIGSNFEVVWAEFDTERLEERMLKRRAGDMIKATLLSLDPVNYSRHLKLEVYHDSKQNGGTVNDVFLGEATTEIDIRPTTMEKVEGALTLKLESNFARSKREVTGEVTVSYVWAPENLLAREDADGTLIKGALTVTVVSARRLAAVDWKCSGVPDCYVKVSCYPDSPHPLDGKMAPQVRRTSTIVDDPMPTWQQDFIFRYDWNQMGVMAKQDLERRRTQDLAPGDDPLVSCLAGMLDDKYNGSGSPFASPPSTHRSAEVSAKGGTASMGKGQAPSQDNLAEEVRLIGALASLRGEVAGLQTALPQLHTEVSQLQHGAKLILERLKKSGKMTFVSASHMPTLPGTPAP